MPGDDLGELWRKALNELPDGWRFDSLQCASTGLSPHDRSEDWVAVAIGPDALERRARGPSAAAAIDALVTAVVAG